MTKPLIYLCEDDAELAAAIRHLLQQEGYDCEWFYDRETLDQGISISVPDLLILDVQLPGDDGFSISQRLRQNFPLLRIVIMSVKHDQRYRQQGYDAGAMLYLPKPFDPNALLAFLQGIFTDQTQSDTLLLRPSLGLLQYQHQNVRLTPSEISILQCLVTNHPQPAEYHLLMEAADFGFSDQGRNLLEVNVSRLRKKIRQINKDSSTGIGNKTRVGYYLTQDIAVV